MQNADKQLEIQVREENFPDLFPIIILEKMCVLLYTRMQFSVYCTEDGFRPICSGQKSDADYLQNII